MKCRLVDRELQRLICTHEDNELINELNQVDDIAEVEDVHPAKPLFDDPESDDDDQRREHVGCYQEA